MATKSSQKTRKSEIIRLKKGQKSHKNCLKNVTQDSAKLSQENFENKSRRKMAQKNRITKTVMKRAKREWR